MDAYRKLWWLSIDRRQVGRIMMYKTSQVTSIQQGLHARSVLATGKMQSNFEIAMIWKSGRFM